MEKRTLPTDKEDEIIVRLAQRLTKSGCYPSVKGNADIAYAMLLKGWGLGLPPGEALDGFQVVTGKIAFTANLIASLMASHGYTWHKTLDTDTEVMLEVFRNGIHAGWSGFTM